MKIALPLQQHPRFATALGVMGRPVRHIRIEGASPVVAVRFCGQLLASRGPVWVNDVKRQALADSGLRMINADAPDPHTLRQAGFRQIATAAFVAELDLTGSNASRIANLHGKWRNIWRRAQLAPVVIAQEPFEAQKHAWLLQADTAQQRAKRFRALPHGLISAFAPTSPDATLVFTAYHDSKPLAAMLFLRHDPVVTYHLGWTGIQGRKWGLHHRLLMAAANHFAHAGLSRMDLGTVDTEQSAGLARFKIGSGALVRPLGGTWLRLPF